MLPQKQLIESVKTAVLADARVEAALMYGSFTQGEGDEYSDIEFYLYLRDPEDFDLRAWLEANVAPVLLLHTNQFGTPNAIFDGLIRGEFHVERESAMQNVLDWPGRDVNVDAMLVKDETGELRAVLETLRERGEKRPPPEAEIQERIDQLLNDFTFGSGVLLRGERMRALDHLSWIQRQLMRLARLSENSRNRLAPQRAFEREITPHIYARLEATVRPLSELEQSYAEAWRLAQDLLDILRERSDLDAREAVTAQLGARFWGQA